MCLCFGCINLGPCKTTNPQQHALWKKKCLYVEPARRGNKYNAKRSRSLIDGKEYGSKLECAVGDRLKMRVKLGEIKDLKDQPRVFLTDAKISYKPDFSYVDCETGKLRYVEAKGAQGARWRVIKKLWGQYGPAPLEIWMGTYRSPKLVEVIGE